VFRNTALKHYAKYIGIVPVIALVWCYFQLHTAAAGPLMAHLQRATHLGLALALAYAMFRERDANKAVWKQLLYFAAMTLAIASVVYMFLDYERIGSRIAFVHKLLPGDYFFGLVLVALVFEASRRVCGNAMTILAAIFVVYGFIGPWLPGLLNHRGMDIRDMVEVMYFSSQGLLGEPIAVSVTYVFYFILFSAFLEKSGAGQVIIDIAFRLTGRSKGGPAKAAVVASAGMGTISGSAVANVVSTGVITIPLMKKVGFPPKLAASVEALASSGGQLLPPVMGAAAFLMANTIGVPYSEVALAAAIPAILFYVGVYVTIHLQSDKLGLAAMLDQDKKELTRQILGKAHLLIPLAALIYFMFFANMLLQKAAFWAMVVLVAAAWLRKSTRMNLTAVLDALVEGTKGAVQVAVSCAIAGIIVGIVMHTGLGIRFTSLILTLSMGEMLLTVVLVAIACIILSMGMPTSSAYIMASVLLAPALTSFGFPLMAAHMFILYFAIFSMITPPVALASYAASSIAKSDPHKTGLYAFYLAMPGFLIAFALLFNPELVLIGSWFDIAVGTAMTFFGVTALAMAVTGFYRVNLPVPLRLVLAAAGIVLILPNVWIGLIGLAAFAAVFVLQWLRMKKSSQPAAADGARQ